jgi:hypothetical protein
MHQFRQTTFLREGPLRRPDESALRLLLELLDNAGQLCRSSFSRFLLLLTVRRIRGKNQERVSSKTCASTVSCMETWTTARGSTQDTRKNHLAAVPVSMQDTIDKLTIFLKMTEIPNDETEDAYKLL